MPLYKTGHKKGRKGGGCRDITWKLPFSRVLCTWPFLWMKGLSTFPCFPLLYMKDITSNCYITTAKISFKIYRAFRLSFCQMRPLVIGYPLRISMKCLTQLNISRCIIWLSDGECFKLKLSSSVVDLHDGEPFCSFIWTRTGWFMQWRTRADWGKVLILLYPLKPSNINFVPSVCRHLHVRDLSCSVWQPWANAWEIWHVHRHKKVLAGNFFFLFHLS